MLGSGRFDLFLLLDGENIDPAVCRYFIATAISVPQSDLARECVYVCLLSKLSRKLQRYWPS